MIKDLLRPAKHALMRELSKREWRRTPEGQAAIATFAGLKDTMAGRDAILLCNGPSLNKVPFERLAGGPAAGAPYLIGMNKINLLFDRTAMRPDMIVAINRFVIEQNAEFYNETAIPLMIAKAGIGTVNPRPNVTFLNCAPTLKFSRDPGLAIHEGWTVTYAALQIAFHLGFARVAIVGADHNFVQTGKPNELQVSKGADVNHFDPRYFGTGTPWQLADLEGSERAYRLARQVYEGAGRKLYNATEGGQLEIFTRMPLDTFLETGPRPA